MEEKQEKKQQPEFKGKMGIVWLTGILVIILGCVTVYTFKLVNENKKLKQIPQAQQPQVIEQEQKTEETAKEEKKETTSNTTTENENSLILFDGSKVINSNKKNYTLSCQGNAGIWIEIDKTQKVLTFSYTPTKVVKYYSLNWTSNKDSVVNSKINFNKKIVDIFFGGMGQSVSGDTVFVLLEDGTVEYIPIVHMFNHVQGDVVSYGKINGVNDVIKFALASSSDGSVTTLAIKRDGTFYDLWNNLKDKGNY